MPLKKAFEPIVKIDSLLTTHPLKDSFVLHKYSLICGKLTVQNLTNLYDALDEAKKIESDVKAKYTDKRSTVDEILYYPMPRMYVRAPASQF